MNSTRALLLSLVVVLGAIGATVAVAQPAHRAGGTGTVGGSVDVAAGNHTASNNSSMGTQISSFMQTSSASAQGSVDNGMWGAQVNGSDNATKLDLVNARAGQLEQRLDSLEERKATLIAKYENGTISEVAYKAQMSRIAGEIAAIESALNQTEPVAREVGANVTQIEQLRTEAANLTGPEVAAVARNISGFTPPAGAAGNGTGVGVGNGTAGQGNQSVGTGNGSGVGTGGNGTQTGNTSQTGNTTQSGNATQSGNTTQSGNATQSGNTTQSGTGNESAAGNTTDGQSVIAPETLSHAALATDAFAAFTAQAADAWAAAVGERY